MEKELHESEKKLNATEKNLQQIPNQLKRSRNVAGGGFSLPEDSVTCTLDDIRYYPDELLSTSTGEVINNRGEVLYTYSKGEIIYPKGEDLCPKGDNSSPKSAEATDLYVNQLMSELLHQPNHQHNSVNDGEYVEKLKLVFEKIQIGDIHHINERECFFKLRHQENSGEEKKKVNGLGVLFCDKTPVRVGRRCRKLVFQNDSMLLEANRHIYMLNVWIRNYNLLNAECFLVNTKNNHHKEVIGDVDDSINWDLFTQDNGEFMLYFKK